MQKHLAADAPQATTDRPVHMASLWNGQPMQELFGGTGLSRIVPAETTDRKRQDVGRHQPGKMVHDRLRFPAGIGEDGAVGHRPDDAVRLKQGQSGALQAGAKA